MQKKISVGIADMKLTRQEGVLITYALGSCIGITFYDPMIKLGALLHIMLPEKTNSQDSNILKYADTGIQETLRKFYTFGGQKGRTVCKIGSPEKIPDQIMHERCFWMYRPVRYRYEQRAVRRNISKEERENGRYRDIIGIRDK